MNIVKQISPRAEQIVSEHDLGQIRVEYSENLLARGLGFTLLAPAFTDGNWWQRMGNLSYFLMGGTCFSLFGLIGMTMVVVTLWKGEKRLYLAEKGFVVVRRQIETIMRWDSVAEIHKHIVFIKRKSDNVQQVRSSCSYTIIPTEGKRASFLAEPGPIIEETVTAYQFPSTLEHYISGKTLSFGWLTLDSKGLHLTPTEGSTNDLTILAKLPGAKRTSQELQGICVASGEFFLPWEQLACYWIDESRSTLILSRQGERKHWVMVPLYQIANLALCLALIDHICFANTPEIERRSEGEQRVVSQPELLEMAAPEEQQLGSLLAIYQTQATRAGTLVFWGIGLFWLLLIGVFVGAFIWLIVPDITDPFFTPFFYISTVALPIVALAVAFVILWWQLRVHTSLATPIRRKIAVSLYERGFVYREGRKLQGATWEQLRWVERLALPRKKMPRRYYKLVMKDATDITLPVVIAGIHELGAAIEGEIMKRQLPGVLADYNAQKPVTFPGFCLNQEGISKSDERLLWTQVEQVSLAKEKLTVKEIGGAKDWLSIPAVQVRNICVLEALLARIREVQSVSMDDSLELIK